MKGSKWSASKAVHWPSIGQVRDVDAENVVHQIKADR